MKKCSECNIKMLEKTGKTPDGVGYNYYKCQECGDEIVDIKQLHNVAEKYRNLKKYRVKISKWGMSAGIRIPKDLIARYKFKNEASLIPEKEGILIIP